MDPTVIAAYIAGAFLVATYVATEVVKIVSARRQARATATSGLLAALADAARSEVRIVSRWFPPTRAILDVSSRSLLLIPVVGRRDHDLVNWVGMMCVRAMREPDQEARVTALARINAVVLVWSIEPRKGRRAVARDREDVDAFVGRVEAGAD